MTRLITQRLSIAALLVAGAALSACEEPRSARPSETVVVEADAPEALAAEDAGVAAAEVAPPTDAPPPVDALPAEKRTSEESVQPESETLFY